MKNNGKYLISTDLFSSLLSKTGEKKNRQFLFKNLFNKIHYNDNLAITSHNTDFFSFCLCNVALVFFFDTRITEKLILLIRYTEVNGIMNFVDKKCSLNKSLLTS